MEYLVAGAYIERDGGVIVRARAARMHIHGPWQINYVDHATVKWPVDDRDAAVKKLRELARYLTIKPDQKPISVAVAGYGPFLSLNPDDPKNYGKTHKERPHWPMRGVDYVSIFKSALEKTGGADQQPYIHVHTDATACAIGEAMTRNMPSDRVLASLVVGKGIGLGLIRDGMPLPSVLHPEIGLLPADLEPDKGLPKEIRKRLKEDLGKSLAQRAANDAMCKRAEIKRLDGDDHPKELQLKKDGWDWLWEVRAKYLAQACLACVSICPPNLISIHAYIDPFSDDEMMNVGSQTYRHFRRLMSELSEQHQPVLYYEDLEKDDFISSTAQRQSLNGASSIASTGAMGMCQAAAKHAYDIIFEFPEKRKA